MLDKALRTKIVRGLLVAAIAIGVAIDAFFAVVNFYPIAPKPSRGPKRYVVMQLDAAQAKWFQDNILDDFNTEANVDVQLIRVDDDAQLQPALAQAVKDGKDVVAITLPLVQTQSALDAKLVHPYTDAIAPKRIAGELGGLGTSVLAPGKRNGEQAFLPRMTVVDVLAYRVSKVRDAILHWTQLRPQIDAALRAVNGHGLPADYELNLSPDQWDAYDIFVMSYYWAHRKYNGMVARPRVAHRTGDSLDGQLDIAAGLYGMGMTDATLAQFSSRAAIDYFQWETLYRAEKLYPSAMYGPKPFEDDQVVAMLALGELYLAPIDALDAFTLHGGAHADAKSQVDDPGDLDFTELPNGASLALAADHHAQRTSPSFSFRQDWVWALPVGTKSAEVGYRLVKFLWRPEIHARECEALGMLPSHPEVVVQKASRFRLGWMTRIFEAGLEQAEKGKAVPPALVDRGIGSQYAQLWTKIVAGGVPPSEIRIAEMLGGVPPPHRNAPEPAPVVVQKDAGSAAPKIDEDVAAAIDHPAPESDDWETDAVFDLGSAAGSAGSATASGARP